jgi:hypothetical protein
VRQVLGEGEADIMLSRPRSAGGSGDQVMTPIKHTAALPLGFTAEFRWDNGRLEGSAGEFVRQPREKVSHWVRRWLVMTHEEQDRSNEYNSLQDHRARVLAALKVAKSGGIPGGQLCPTPLGDCSRLQAIRARYEAALSNAMNQYRERIAATPVDDAAWEEEIRSRGQCL